MATDTERSSSARFLAWSLWASAASGLAVVAWGGYLIADDARSHTDEFDGLGEFFGTVIVGAGLLWSLVFAGLAIWLARGQRRGRPATAVGAVSAIVAVPGLVASPMAVGVGPDSLVTLVLPIGVSLLVVLAGVTAAVNRPGRTDLRTAPVRRH